MNKFIAIIDDENYTCPLEHEGYCHIALNKYYKCMEDCDGILNDRPEFCPLKEYEEAIPIKWLCDYATIIAENNYEQAKFIFRLIETYKGELNEDKDKVAIDNLKRLKENLLKTKSLQNK